MSNVDAPLLPPSPPHAGAPAGPDALERAIARSGASVLIQGETGSGKELLARRLHAASGRAGPFVAVNCGALADGLLDAELFGHEAGAFTGAHCGRAGWFEAARGGTLFLDEVGELSATAQVRLLRVLQERQLSRLGSRRSVDIDLRIVAATHVDLLDAVRAGRFRLDLYWRLNVAPLRVAPLRERRGEILPLARHFLRLHAGRLGVAPRALGADAAERLLAHAWPGNVRELENCMQAALVMGGAGPVGADELVLVSLPPGVVGAAAATAATAAAAPEAVPAPVAPPQPVPAASPPPSDEPALDALFDRLLARGGADGAPPLLQAVESSLVRRAFDRSRGNQVQAARLLGITRNSMRTLLRRHALA